MSPLLRLCAFLAASILLSVPARAINSRAGTSGAAFLKLGAGSRAGGMAESFSAVADDVTAAYYNPAALTRLTKSELAAAHTQHFQGIDYEYGAFAYPFGRGEEGSRHVLAFSLYNLSVSGIQRRTQDSDAPIGTFAAGDYAYSASYANKISETLSAGVNGKYIHQMIDSYRSDAFAIDAAVLYVPRPKSDRRLSVSGVLKNVGTKPSFAGITDPLPTGITVGLGADILPRVWKANLDLTKYNDTDLFGAIGTEYSHQVNDSFSGAFRAGFSTHRRENTGFNELTLGAGVRFHRAGFDFAWVPFGDLGSTFRYSLVVKF